MNGLAVAVLALAFLFVMLVRWASRSLPRAIVFVALLCATPYALAIGLGLLAALGEHHQHVVGAKF